VFFGAERVVGEVGGLGGYMFAGGLWVSVLGVQGD